MAPTRPDSRDPSFTITSIPAWWLGDPVTVSGVWDGGREWVYNPRDNAWDGYTPYELTGISVSFVGVATQSVTAVPPPPGCTWSVRCVLDRPGVTVAAVASGTERTLAPNGQPTGDGQMIYTGSASTTAMLPTVGITAPAANQPVPVQEGGGPTTVMVTATSSSSVGGGIGVFVDTIPQPNSQSASVRTDLHDGDDTHWSGPVPVGTLPGPQTLRATAQRISYPQAQATADVTVTVVDASPPHLSADNIAPAPGSTLLLPASHQLRLVGTASDPQSGMVGGNATVQWASTPTAEKAPVTATGPHGANDFTTWALDAAVTAYGTLSLYFWATDQQGNSTPNPVTWRADFVPDYTPATLSERLADWIYLQKLVEFSADQITAGAAGAAGTQQLNTVLTQPLARLDEPPDSIEGPTANTLINELRIPVELLRTYITANGVSTRPGEVDEAAALLAGYEAALAASGTSYTELRLARGADATARPALAARLGIALSPLPGSTGSRPDQLDAITLAAGTVTEAALEALFGVAATTGDPLRYVHPGQLFAWQLAAQATTWRRGDRITFGGTGAVLVDPDVISAADVNTGSSQAPAVLNLLTSRAQQLSGEESALNAIVQACIQKMPPDLQGALTGLVARDAPGVNLDTLAATQAAGGDISATLTAAGLTPLGFAYLYQLQTLTRLPSGTVTADEWHTAVEILTGAFRRRTYPAWAATESDVALAPDLFTDSGTAPQISTWRVDPAARTTWAKTLQTRVTQRQSLTDSASYAVAQAEQAWLPLLRDALVRDIPADPAVPDVGEWLTARYHVDFKASGALQTTRMRQSIQSVQDLIAAVRGGNTGPGTPLAGWSLTSGVAAFDEAWSWIGSEDGWRSATTTWLFPEDRLDPANLPDQSHGYTDLCTSVLGLKDLVADDALTCAANYATAQDAWTGGTAITYWPASGQTRDANQSTLRDHSATVASTHGGTAAREMFWAVPMLIGQRLQQSGQYQAALDWYWIAYPYNDAATVSAYDVINTEVAATKPGANPPPPDVTFIPGWTANLDPFHVLDGRPTATAPYLRSTLLAIIGCLAQYADSEFALDTDESVAHARDLYLSATALLTHPSLTPIKPGNAGEGALWLPSLDTLRNQVRTRLSKLRQGRNIAGLLRVAAGQSYGGPSVTQPTPYHYKVLLARAQQLTGQSAQIEALYLSLLEKYDQKALSLNDAAGAAGIAALQLTVHDAQVTAADDGQTAAQDQITKAQTMVTVYQDAITAGPNQYERALLDGYEQMRTAQDVMAGIDAVIGIAQATARFDLSNPESWFGSLSDVVLQGSKAVAQVVVNDLQSQAQANQLQAGIEDRLQQFAIQRASATQDVIIAQAQAKTAADQVDIAQSEREVARAQQDQATRTLTLLQNQFTNPNLYKWMSTTIGAVYQYSLQQATATARLAQSQLAFDRAEPARAFIAGDYTQTPRQLQGSGTDTKGLTGAEQLSEAITQLDSYAFSTDSRQLNLSQTFSLAQLMPPDFAKFRATGELVFATPMAWFDNDFPGHYQRRIRRVRLSMVALIPPSRGVRATLSNTGLSRTVTRQGAVDFPTVIVRRDPEVVAATSPLNATGVFDLDLQPDMLLPFEGLGVDTSWLLDLPKPANPFDYATLSDVLLTIEYTAMSDAGYRADVITGLNSNRQRRSDIVYSLARDFPDQWYGLNNPPAGARRTATVTLQQANVPIGIDPESLQVAGVAAQLTAGTPPGQPPTNLGTTVTLSYRDTSDPTRPVATGTAETNADGYVSSRTGAPDWSNNLTGSSPVGIWTLTFPTAADPLFAGGALTDILLLVNWTGQATAWPT